MMDSMAQNRVVASFTRSCGLSSTAATTSEAEHYVTKALTWTLGCFIGRVCGNGLRQDLIAALSACSLGSGLWAWQKPSPARGLDLSPH